MLKNIQKFKAYMHRFGQMIVPIFQWFQIFNKIKTLNLNYSRDNQSQDIGMIKPQDLLTQIYTIDTQYIVVQFTKKIKKIEFEFKMIYTS